MTEAEVLAEQRGRVALLTLNRPEKLNAWTDTMMVQLRGGLEAAAENDDVGAVVVTGAGRAYCAGADINNFRRNADARDAGIEPDRSGGAPAPETNWVDFLRGFPKPTIAAVNGAAVGVGVTHILSMDIRIAGEAARFGMFFVRMGLVPELASSALLPQMVGQARALEWCLSGRLIEADEALRAGMVSEVVAADRLVDRAVEIGEHLSGQSAYAMTRIRQLITGNTNETDMQTVMEREAAALAGTYRSWEHREAIEAFLSKRRPDFRKQTPTRD